MQLNEEYRQSELELDDINQLLWTIPSLIEKAAYDYEGARTDLEKIKARVLKDAAPEETKNAEMREAFLISNSEYCEKYDEVVKLRLLRDNYKDNKECVIEIARNKRAAIKTSLEDNVA